MNDDSSHHDVIDELVDEFVSRKQAGEAPTVSEYCRRYPELEEQIRELFPMLTMLEDVKSQPQNPGLEKTAAPERIGGYRILRPIGQGGMGVVYEAEHESLGRRAALKVLPQRLSNDDVALARFEREARAVAKLHHTNIVPLFEMGQDDGQFFLAMQLIRGQSLDHVIADLQQAGSGSGGDRLRRQRPQAESDSTLPTDASSDFGNAPGLSDQSSSGSSRSEFFRSVAQIGLQAAEALEYAHQRNIIHRDIKPSNLLLDESGVVWLTDFGLAKTDDDDLTRTGDFLGTLRYMAPERFQGKCDVRSDIYSLGLTLYEMLARRPAFQSSNRLRMIDLITRTEPTRLRSVNPRVPRDLETIVLKAIDKEPRTRYASAAELAEDLRRFLDDRTITARRHSATERLLRWSRRNKGLAAALGAVCLLLVFIAVGSTIAAWHFQTQAIAQRTLALEKQKETLRAVAAEARTQRSLYSAQMFLAGEALRDQGGIARAIELTNAWRPTAELPDLRGWEWYYLQSLAGRERLTIAGHPDMVLSVDWSPQQNRLASCDPAGFVKIWDAATGEELGSWNSNSYVIQCVRWSPDGTRLAIGGGNQVLVWDAQDDAPKLVVADAHEDMVWAVRWSPDGTHLASASQDRTVKIWNSSTGEQVLVFERYNAPVQTIDWSPDGKLIACGGDGQDIYIFSTDTGEEFDRLIRHSSIVRQVAWSPDGKMIASAGNDRTVRLWRPRQGHLHTFSAPNEVYSVAWDPQGEWLATGNWDGSVRVIDVESRQEIRKFFGHTDRVWEVCWSPDGQQLASSSIDRTVRIWDSVAQYESHALQTPSINAGLCFSPDGKRLAAATVRNEIAVTDLQTHEEIRLAGVTGGLFEIRFSPDGKLIAAGASRNPARVWNAATGEVVRVFDTAGEHSRAIAWSPDGAKLAVAVLNEIKIWDQAADEVVLTLTGHTGPIITLDWSPDGAHLASGGMDQSIRIWDAAAGGEITVLRGHTAAVQCVRWSPNSNEIASTAKDHSVRIWIPSSSTQRLVMRAPAQTINAVCWSPDGSRLASGGADAAVRIWNVDSGVELLALTGHRLVIQVVAWSPDGQRIASSSWDQSVRIWDAARAYDLERESLGD